MLARFYAFESRAKDKIMGLGYRPLWTKPCNSLALTNMRPFRGAR